MPTYQVEDAQGRILEIEGEREPTDAELSQLFANAFPQEDKPAEVTPPDVPAAAPFSTQPVPPDYGATARALTSMSPEAREEMGKPLGQIPEALTVSPLVLAAKVMGIPGANRAYELNAAASRPLKGLAEAATSPIGIAMAPMLPVAELAVPLMGVLGAKSTMESAKQAVEGFKEGNTEKIIEGTVGTGVNALLTGVAAGGSAVAIKRAVAPASTAAAEQAATLIPEGRRLYAPRTPMPEFTESTLAPSGPPLRRLPAPGETEGSVLLPESPLGPRTVGYRIKLPLEPAAAKLARERWDKPIDIEAQVEGADALRQMVSLSEEVKVAGKPYEPPSVNVDLRQLERVMQRNTVSKVEAWADKVIKDKLGGTSANPFLDPEFVAAAGVKGAILVKRGVVDFGKWSNEMRKQFGRDIDPYLPTIFEQASQRRPQTEPIQESHRTEEASAQSRIHVKPKEQDVMPARDVIASPEFEFRKDPVASSLATDLVEANLAFKSRRDHTVQQLEAVQKTLPQSEQEALTKAMLAKESQVDPAAIDKLSREAQGAWKVVRTLYDNVRERVAEGKQASVISELSGPQQNALQMIRDGISLDEAARANGLRSAGKAIVQSAADEIKELQNWGIEDYTTHIERGSFRLVTDDGTTVAVAETKAAAASKADRWLKENPGKTESLTITDEFNPGVEFPTKLSQGQYFRFVQRLKENLGESAGEIQRLLHENGSIVAVKPTNKYASPLLQRRNILKGEENVFDVLPYYVHVMEKKLALDPVLRRIRNEAGQLPKNARAQIEQLAQDVKGTKPIEDHIADYLLSWTGGKPFAYSRGTAALRELSTNLKLGYRPVAAIVNRTSGLHHTWTKVGTKYLLEGRQWLKTAEGEAALSRNKPYLGIEASFVHEKLRPSSQEPLWKPLGAFQSAERVNRPEAFGAHYKYAEGELGLTGEAAEVYARKATRFGQFVYDLASLPRMMRNPTGRLVFQFKPYLLKELEFISSLRGAEIPRYLAGFLAVGGPRAALYTLKSLPVVGAIVGLDKLEDWLNTNAPAASRGVGGALGVDVSPSVAFQFPKTTSELLGPVISDIYALWKDVVSPALGGEDRDMGDVRKWATRLAPALNYWSQLVEAVSSENGWITDERGRPEYKPSKSDMAKLALGAKPLEKSVQEVEARFLRQQEEIGRKNRTRLIDKFLNAIDEKDGVQIQELSAKLADYGVTPEAVRAAAKNRHIEPQLRLLKSLSKGARAKEAARFAPEE